MTSSGSLCITLNKILLHRQHNNNNNYYYYYYYYYFNNWLHLGACTYSALDWVIDRGHKGSKLPIMCMGRTPKNLHIEC